MFSQRTLEGFFPPRQLFGLGLGFLLSRILAQEEEEKEGEESDRKCSSSLFACSLESGMQEHTLRILFWLFLRVQRLPRLHQDKLMNVFDFGAQKCGFFSCILW
jgi:hypothetical protein